MAGETVITIVGNLTADPELRFTPSGAAVANFTIASTPRNFDKNTSDWKDGETLFMRCSIWREAAENVSETLQKGMRVIAQGRLTQRSYETTSGEKRTVIELEAEEVAPSLKYAKAVVTRTQRNNNGGGFQQRPSQGAQNVASQLGGQPQQGWGAPAQQPAWDSPNQSDPAF